MLVPLFCRVDRRRWISAPKPAISCIFFELLQVYSLIDGQTCVVKLSTFYPDIPVWTLEDFNQVALFFIAELKKAFALANRYSVPSPPPLCLRCPASLVPFSKLSKATLACWPEY